MRPAAMRSSGREERLLFFARVVYVLFILAGPTSLFAQIGVNIAPSIPGQFNPEDDLRAPKPLRMFSSDSLAGLSHEPLLYKYETTFDTSRGIYVATRYLFGDAYGMEMVYSTEDYLKFRAENDRKRLLQKKFNDSIIMMKADMSSGALEIQVPFKIKSKTFRKIFGGDRVGLRVSGNITIDGRLKREKSDQLTTTRQDQANYNFKIDQTQQFTIVGKVGDKVSVEIDQDSERLFDFENAVKLTYTGTEDEIIQSIEAGNVSLSLPGARLATLSAQNKGLFGFKIISKVGPVTITSIASLQRGEKKKITYEEGSDPDPHDIYDIDYVKDKYFFLHNYFRKNYPNFTSNYDRLVTSIEVERLEVYRNVRLISGTNESFYQGWAVYDQYDPIFTNQLNDLPTDQASLLALNEMLDDMDTLKTSRMAYSGLWQKLEDGVDYEYFRKTGVLRMSMASGDQDIIAVAYRLSAEIPGSHRQWGVIDPEGSQVILKLVKPENHQPSDSTWTLSMKNIYDVGTSGLRPDDFTFQIIRNNTDRYDNRQGIPWIEILGVDNKGESSDEPDGLIDPIFVDYARGEVHFPDPRPFDPVGYTVGGEKIISLLKAGAADTTADSLRNPNIYDVLPNSGTTIYKNFILRATYSNASSVINLGINVLEGSEEVLLNGARLQKDRDYYIDYLSGQIKILDDSAFASGAKLEINYESGEIFQLDKRTMLGFRVEYALWEDSFIGGTFLYFNEKPLDRRIKLGNEPKRNMIWDLNTRLRFRPYWMTQAVDAIPLIDTDEPSEITFEGEIAQVFPNPNSMSNDATDDPDGVAYIDDFEGSKRATPLGIMRSSWKWASFPKRIPVGDSSDLYREDYDVRGKFHWDNPRTQVKIQDIWPNRQVNSKVANTVYILKIDYDPRKNNFRTNSENPKEVWNGVMRWLSAGYYNQSNTKFIEIWAQWTGGGEDATLYIDMGEISEDVIPNEEYDTEDELIAGVGNGIIDSGEDVGLDGMEGADPPWDFDATSYDFNNPVYDWWDLDGDGAHDPDEPFSTDDWSTNNVPGTIIKEQINGTENNSSSGGQADEGGNYPDSEDLNGDNKLNDSDRFFRYRFRMNNAEDSLKYIVGGQDNPNKWYLIRIPIDDVFDQIGSPSLTQVKYLRMWLGGASTAMTMRLAQFELVGNEWQSDSLNHPVTGERTVFLASETVNTYDNPEAYEPPPGVTGEIDPITDLRGKEQSLVIKVKDLPAAAEGQMIKTIRNSQSFLEYKKLKMFVNGGGRFPEALLDKDLEMFFRFGTGFEGQNRAYYEYSQKLYPGWENNEIVVTIEQLTKLKAKADATGVGYAYDVLPNGDVLKVIGNPSIGSISSYAIGLRNLGQPITEEDNVEIWVDELRLSGVLKEVGMAMRSSLSTKFADFLDLRANLEENDAEYHRVDERTGSNKTTLKSSFVGTVHLNKFLDPKWGVQIPVSTTINSDLAIPKYTIASGDIRTETIAGNEDLNIWSRFSKMGFSREHMKDKFLVDDLTGEVIEDTSNGLPVQDLSQWGIDTLFTTSQQYSWRTSFKKTGKSSNWLPKYSIDRLTLDFSHSQKYSSSVNEQYNKSFNNTGKFTYSLPFPKADLPVFGWTSKIPVIKKLSDSKFNYWPSALNYDVTGTQVETSIKRRNAAEVPTYKFNLDRSFSTSYAPFQKLSASYSYTVNSALAKEDSVRQQILWKDQVDSLKNLTYAPATAYKVIIEDLLLDIKTLIDGYIARNEDVPDDIQIFYDDILFRYTSGDDEEELVNDIYYEFDTSTWDDELEYKRPWQSIANDDPHYKRTFWEVGGLPFVDTRKTQRISTNYSPELFNWLTTTLDYSSNYNWDWSGYSYTGRKASTNTNMGANVTLHVRQLIPQAKGAKGRGGRDRGRGRGGRDRGRDRDRKVPGASGFGRGDDIGRNIDIDSGGPGIGGKRGNKDDKKVEGEAGEEKKFKIPNPLEGLYFVGRRLQNVSFNYSQRLTNSVPQLEDDTPSLLYQLGLTGKSGVDQLAVSEAIQSSSRTDNFTFRSGIDWTTRITSGLDYTLAKTQSVGNQRTDSEDRSGFFMLDNNKLTLESLPVPNYSLRWSGVEQIGPLSNWTQSITLEHQYSGRYTESGSWNKVDPEEGQPDSIDVYQRQVTKKEYDKSFSPLVGVSVTWKYGITSSIRYNWKQHISEDPLQQTLSRNTDSGITLSARYTRKSGFKVPIPVWPFKNKRFNNETTFSLDYTFSQSLKEKGLRDPVDIEDKGFSETSNSMNWSISPSIDYKFSRTVRGGLTYRYGVTKQPTNTTNFQEFGVNVNISIRG